MGEAPSGKKMGSRAVIDMGEASIARPSGRVGRMAGRRGYGGPYRQPPPAATRHNWQPASLRRILRIDWNVLTSVVSALSSSRYEGGAERGLSGIHVRASQRSKHQHSLRRAVAGVVRQAGSG